MRVQESGPIHNWYANLGPRMCLFIDPHGVNAMVKTTTLKEYVKIENDDYIKM